MDRQNLLDVWDENRKTPAGGLLMYMMLGLWSEQNQGQTPSTNLHPHFFWASGSTRSLNLFPRRDPFDPSDERYGPSIYTVVEQLIKPRNQRSWKHELGLDEASTGSPL